MACRQQASSSVRLAVAEGGPEPGSRRRCWSVRPCFASRSSSSSPVPGLGQLRPHLKSLVCSSRFVTRWLLVGYSRAPFAQTRRHTGSTRNRRQQQLWLKLRARGPLERSGEEVGQVFGSPTQPRAWFVGFLMLPYTDEVVSSREAAPGCSGCSPRQPRLPVEAASHQTESWGSRSRHFRAKSPCRRLRRRRPQPSPACVLFPVVRRQAQSRSCYVPEFPNQGLNWPAFHFRRLRSWLADLRLRKPLG